MRGVGVGNRWGHEREPQGDVRASRVCARQTNYVGRCCAISHKHTVGTVSFLSGLGDFLRPIALSGKERRGRTFSPEKAFLFLHDHVNSVSEICCRHFTAFRLVFPRFRTVSDGKGMSAAV